MKNKKMICRFAAFAMTAVFLLSASACAGNSGNESAETDTAVVSEISAVPELTKAAEDNNEETSKSAEESKKEKTDAEEEGGTEKTDTAEESGTEKTDTAEESRKEKTDTAEKSGKEKTDAAEESEKEKTDAAKENEKEEPEQAEGYDVLAKDNEVFSGEKMGFSFLYSGDHKAQTESDGSARILIGSDDTLSGLTVCVSEPDEKRTPQEMLEEYSKEVQEKYKDQLTEPPVQDSLDWEGHNLSCLLYTYTRKDGTAVDCGEYIEKTGSRSVIYRTEALQSESGLASEALALAVVILHTDPDHYRDLAGDGKTGEES